MKDLRGLKDRPSWACLLLLLLGGCATVTLGEYLCFQEELEDLECVHLPHKVVALAEVSKQRVATPEDEGEEVARIARQLIAAR